MQFIKLLKSSAGNIYVNSIQVETSQANYNVPTMHINMIRDVSVADINQQAFSDETEALNAALTILNISAEGVKWFHSVITNEFITRLLTDEQGCIATDQAISQWKNGTLQLYLTDVYITLDRR